MESSLKLMELKAASHLILGELELNIIGS